MAIIMKRDNTGKKCWMCGREIDRSEVAIVSTGARDMLYMHPYCAESLSRRILGDLSQLADLGFEISDGLEP